MEGFFKTLFFVVLIAGIVLFGWLLRDKWMPKPEAPAPFEVPAETADDEEPDRGPLHPIAAAPELGLDGRQTESLPALDDSDGFFRLETGTIFGKDFEALLVREDIIDRFVASIDSLSRKQVSDKVRPVESLSTEFSAEGIGPIVLGESNFQRYDALMAHIAAANLNDVEDMYRRYYPLFQKSYERLGYPNAYFNDRLIEVIDLLLATPQPTGPIALVQPNVLYEFADPALEELASGQKLLLRVGPQHATTIKDVLRELRSRLSSSE